MRQPTNQEKELATSLAKIVSKIVPELVDRAGQSNFDLTIRKDKDGIAIEIDLDYKEDLVHRDFNQEEWKETFGAIASKAMKENNFNVKKAARQIGLTEDEFRRYMKIYNI